MSYKLTHGLVPVNGQLVETYLRQTQANEDVKTTLGLSTDEQILANIGLASIEEYLTLQTTSTIDKGEFVIWDLSPLEQPFKVESILIDSPSNDTFTFQLLDENGRVKISLIFERKKTPYDFPLMVVPVNWKIKIIAQNSAIDFLQIIGKPVALLNNLLPVEQIITENPRGVQNEEGFFVPIN
ncbi:MAG: hypothetical protein QNJ70_29830 [Xenococcaceae cyanobacterium MO_207.B15]|nr:hypothetical protein [Xenococcaceae cyanobacterium MO_207.B15]